MVSIKQNEILLKNGYTQEAINQMSYQNVSKVIGDIFAKDKENKPVEKLHVASFEMNQKPKMEYHLTPEQVRTNALMAAQIWYPHLLDSPKEIELFWKCVTAFEEYIQGRSN